VSFASAEIALATRTVVLRAFLQKKHADPNEPPVMLGEAREMHCPFGRQRKS
jgi:hypothetical protein